MIPLIINTCLDTFEQDCRLLCEYHYPTVHNRGLKESHIGKAFARRLVHYFDQMKVPYRLLKPLQPASSGAMYSIILPHSRITIIASQFNSANQSAKKHLFEKTCFAYHAANQNPVAPFDQHIVVLADHWFDRSHCSRILPAWWLGHLPHNLQDYQQQGVKLAPSDDSFPLQIEQAGIVATQAQQIRHPLVHRNTQLPLKRYMLFSCLLSS